MSEIRKLNPAQAARACVACIKASRFGQANGGLRIVPVMVANPGVGKTTIARDIAKKLGYDGLIVVTPTVHGTLDLRGIPYRNDLDQTAFAPSTLMPKTGKWLVLVDELADCPIHEQSGFYQLLLDGTIGEYRLPADCDVIGATNDETMGACSNPLSSAIKTRVCLIHVQSDVDQTIKHGLSKNWHPLVLGFIRTNQDCLDGFNPDDFAGGSTGRGLEQLSQLEHSGFPAMENVIGSIATGLIGQDFGERYAIFRKLQIPDPNEVLNNPETAPIMDEPGKQFAYSAAICVALKSDPISWFKSVCTYAKRLDRVSAIGLISDCKRTDSSLTNSPQWAHAIRDYGDILL